MNNQKTMAISFADEPHPTANREYKSTVFSLLYNDPDRLLSLYNALNQSHYTNSEELKIVTLSNAVYMGMKNDKAFVLDRQPERQILKLSDLYIQSEEEPMLELKVEFLNINEGYNEELKEACESLKEYCLFVERVRRYTVLEDTLKKAVDRAVKECIEEGILKDFLIENRGEVMAMSLLEFTLEDWLILQEEEKELACEEARQEGEKIGEDRQKEKGLKAMVNSLQKYIPSFEGVYQEVIANEEYRDYGEEQVKKYYKG